MVMLVCTFLSETVKVTFSELAAANKDLENYRYKDNHIFEATF